jgi:hypothetical protein
VFCSSCVLLFSLLADWHRYHQKCYCISLFFAASFFLTYDFLQKSQSRSCCWNSDLMADYCALDSHHGQSLRFCCAVRQKTGTVVSVNFLFPLEVCIVDRGEASPVPFLILLLPHRKKGLPGQSSLPQLDISCCHMFSRIQNTGVWSRHREARWLESAKNNCIYRR